MSNQNNFQPHGLGFCSNLVQLLYVHHIIQGDTNSIDIYTEVICFCERSMKVAKRADQRFACSRCNTARDADVLQSRVGVFGSKFNDPYFRPKLFFLSRTTIVPNLNKMGVGKVLWACDLTWNDPVSFRHLLSK